MTYEIFQLAPSHPNCFLGIYLKKEEVKLSDYVQVYKGEFIGNQIGDYILERIFETLNINHPADYHARSLSISDLICCYGDDNKRRWFYVDSFGFTEINIE